ncbi:MAG: TRAP transporter small permease [Spirochaetia bacterium]|jgi:TRAP-type C4-dicarboxylate transport system permease small subunit|nr:TRAP transporter small permease [Spirochaetia bacterium]
MIKFEKLIVKIADIGNWIAAASIVFIMLLTTLDVFLRIFRISITGCYELVGLCSTLAISFSLGYTSLQKGHISVDFLVQHLPRRAKRAIKFINACVAFTLFAVLSWQSFLYAAQLRAAGEVSPTLQIHTYPFVFGVTLGSLLLCLALVVEAMRTVRGADTE